MWSQLRGQGLSIKGAASNLTRFFDVSVSDYEVCYDCKLLSKYFGCLSNPLNCTYDYSFSLKKILKTKIVEQLFEISYVTRKIKWLCNVQHREDYIGHYWSQCRLDDFASRNARRSIFLWANGYYEVQIYGNQINSRSTNKLLFSLQCSPIIIKHVKCWTNAIQPSRVFSRRH